MFVSEYIDLIAQNSDLTEVMLLSLLLLAVGAEVKILANSAHIAESNNRVDAAANTADVLVD